MVVAKVMCSWKKFKELYPILTSKSAYLKFKGGNDLPILCGELYDVWQQSIMSNAELALQIRQK